jgi:hypothetical protein
MRHWVCLTRRNDVFTFFDSYRYKSFQNLNFISKKMNELLGQEKTKFFVIFLKRLKEGSYN